MEENQENMKEEKDRIAACKPTPKTMNNHVYTPTPQPASTPNYNHERVGTRGRTAQRVKGAWQRES
jgi:hypothetical protein